MLGMAGSAADQRIVVRPADLEGAAQLLTSVSDPRVATCLAASWMLRADIAALWEPRERVVVMTASTENTATTRAPAVVMQVLESGERRGAQRRFGCSSLVV